MPFVQKTTWKGIALLFVVIGAICVTLFLRNAYNAHFTWLVAQFGLPGIFGIGVFTNAPIIAPMTGFAFLPFVLNIAHQHNDALVILLYAFGGVIGESTAYLAGVAGKDLSRLEKRRSYKLLQGWFVEKRRGRTFFLMAFLALVPSPYDVIVLGIGAMRYPYPLFFLATLMGRTGKYALMIFLGDEFCLWANQIWILKWFC